MVVRCSGLSTRQNQAVRTLPGSSQPIRGSQRCRVLVASPAVHSRVLRKTSRFHLLLQVDREVFVFSTPGVPENILRALPWQLPLQSRQPAESAESSVGGSVRCLKKGTRSHGYITPGIGSPRGKTGSGRCWRS